MHWEYKSSITVKLLSLKMCLEKYFHKNINIPLFDKYFYKHKESKLGFGDCIAVLNGFLYRYGVCDKDRNFTCRI
jgi:hypothetical protein